MVESTPRARPGKKPTRIAVTGNLLQLAVSAAVGFVEVDAGFAGEVGTTVVEVDDAAEGTESWFLFKMQFVPSQENPKGQHCPAHCANGTESAVVFKMLFGCDVAFWSETSQAMG
jgi:hypothetical protein